MFASLFLHLVDVKMLICMVCDFSKNIILYFVSRYDVLTFQSSIVQFKHAFLKIQDSIEQFTHAVLTFQYFILQFIDMVLTLEEFSVLQGSHAVLSLEYSIVEVDLQVQETQLCH